MHSSDDARLLRGFTQPQTSNTEINRIFKIGAADHIDGSDTDFTEIKKQWPSDQSQGGMIVRPKDRIDIRLQCPDYVNSMQ